MTATGLCCVRRSKTTEIQQDALRAKAFHNYVCVSTHPKCVYTRSSPETSTADRLYICRSMGDPLSLAAGVVRLVSLTIPLLQITAKFKDNVRAVREEVVTLIEEIDALQRVLELLRAAWENKKLPPNFDQAR